MDFIHTLPVNICLKHADPPARGYEVWALNDIAMGERFGPCEETSYNHINNHDMKPDFQEQVEILILDEESDSLSDWLRYVNYTHCKEEANMITFRTVWGLYYITSKSIPAKTELLVYDQDACTEDSNGYGNKHTGSSENVHSNNILLGHSWRSEDKERYIDTKIISEKSSLISRRGRYFNLSSDQNSEIGRKSNTVNEKPSYKESIKENCELVTKKSNAAFKESFTSKVDKCIETRENSKKYKSDIKFYKMEENLPCENASMEEQRNICALVNHDKCEKPPYTEILNTVFVKSNSASNIIKYMGEQLITSSDNQVVKCDDSKNALQLNAKHYPNNKDKLYLSGNKLMLLLLKHHAETNTYKDLKLNRSDNECPQRSHSEQNEDTVLSKQHFQYEQLAEKGCHEIHKNIHISKKIFSSDKCRGKLLNRISLILHKKYIREKSLQNNVCGKKFTQNGNLIANKRNNKGVKPFEFVACGKNFVQSNGMVLHKRIHNGERTFKCSICGRKFFHRGNLILHQRIHAGEKPFECEVCGKTFTLPRGLTAHKNTHTGEKRFECSVCGRKFTRRDGLITHERIHTGEKPFECETCGKAFIQRSGLIIHRRTHTGENFECSVCGRKFTQNINMITHKRIHTGEKPFECKVCGKTFTQPSGLAAHKKTHTGEKRFKCSVCGRKFARRGSLIVHERIHTGEKPFECETCGKTFFQRSGLIIHKRTHTGESFECSICGRKFTQNINMITHKRIHTGEKPFECKVCGKTFTQCSGLTAHKKTHTGKKRF